MTEYTVKNNNDGSLLESFPHWDVPFLKEDFDSILAGEHDVYSLVSSVSNITDLALTVRQAIASCRKDVLLRNTSGIMTVVEAQNIALAEMRKNGWEIPKLFGETS